MKQFAWILLAILLLILVSVHGYPPLGDMSLRARDLIGATGVLVVNVVNPSVPGPGNTGGGTSSGGGGGGGGAAIISGGAVHFSGRAYPYSTVILLKDGNITLSTVAGVMRILIFRYKTLHLVVIFFLFMVLMQEA